MFASTLLMVGAVFGTADAQVSKTVDLYNAGFYRHVFVMERIRTTVRASTVLDILILRTALFPTIFYFSSVDKRQK